MSRRREVVRREELDAVPLCGSLRPGDFRFVHLPEGSVRAADFAEELFLAGRRTLMTTPLTSPAMRDAAHALLAADGVPVSVVRDSAGLVCQRVLATIVNIGADIAQQGIATPDDIDRAVTLGLGYPQGPLALGDALGAATVLRILDGLFAVYRDPRYRPSPWLRRRALLGVSLLTPDN